MRLDKLLEREKIGSKKAVKRLLLRKAVTVDGKPAESEGMNVDPVIQEIKIFEKTLKTTGHSYFMMNKPKGAVTAVKDAKHTTVLDLLADRDKNEKLYPVGRLDRDTEGLLLITDNGPLGYQLIHPSKKVVKRYEVIVNEPLSIEDCRQFAEGITFTGGQQCQPAELHILSSSSKQSLAYLDIQEGKFHQVKKMFLSVGKKVIYLKRLSMGSLFLDSKLKPGEYRRLEPEELKLLMLYFKK
ncbi:16S rRNA pseudouridine(516) synthase [Enterococcus sp. LJL51]|uniref:16S rRNA pseudouridine(516) synthase n=1 Tax=Enterococcus sp. LJL51 TaxID=3416656 RepID=UPI003CEDD9A4